MWKISEETTLLYVVRNNKCFSYGYSNVAFMTVEEAGIMGEKRPGNKREKRLFIVLVSPN